MPECPGRLASCPSKGEHSHRATARLAQTCFEARPRNVSPLRSKPPTNGHGDQLQRSTRNCLIFEGKNVPEQLSSNRARCFA